MELSPRLYNWLVRPTRYNKKFTLKVFQNKFEFKHKKVLDFGCGIGSNCFISKPHSYLGVDIDKKRINYAKYINPEYRFEIFDGKINTLDNSIDIILIIAVLHHISNEKITTILNEFKRILKDNTGILIVLEPCLWEENLFNNFCMKILDRGKYIRKQDEYLQIFKEQNFKINEIEKIKKLSYREILFSASLL
ncbi:MAG: class I SAM-dependent methyltransferase [Firmicutes bacterium]|nr:class I SAM-dependent methyltransferase [Bacillota bacterium]